jgi:hypothetical protein
VFTVKEEASVVRENKGEKAAGVDELMLIKLHE